MNSRFSFDSSPAPSAGRLTPASSPPTVGEDFVAHLNDTLVEPPAPGEATREQGRLVPGGIEGLFVPEGYEPSYAYPLLVWLSGTPLSALELSRRMRQISDRNYLGLALEVDPEHDPAEVAVDVHQAVCELRGQVHIHSERVILAGVGSAGSLALEVGLSRPEWFGGVVALGGSAPTTPRPLANYERLRGFRIMLGLSAGSNDLRSMRRLERLLWTAGVDVALWQCSQTQAGSSAPLLRQIDNWVMAGVERESAVWV